MLVKDKENAGNTRFPSSPLEKHQWQQSSSGMVISKGGHQEQQTPRQQDTPEKKQSKYKSVGSPLGKAASSPRKLFRHNKPNSPKSTPKKGQLREPLLPQSEPEPAPNPLFGVGLPDIMTLLRASSTDNVMQKLPIFVATLIDFLLKHVDVEGIFRLPGEKGRINALKNSVSSINEVPDLTGAEVHDVASLLKLYIRELPEHLIRAHLRDVIGTFLDSDECVDQVAQALSLMNEDEYNLLEALSRLLYTIASHSYVNQMTAANLAVCWAPNLVALPWNPVSNGSQELFELNYSPTRLKMVEFIISNTPSLFSKGKIVICVTSASHETDVDLSDDSVIPHVQDDGCLFSIGGDATLILSASQQHSPNVFESKPPSRLPMFVQSGSSENLTVEQPMATVVLPINEEVGRSSPSLPGFTFPHQPSTMSPHLGLEISSSETEYKPIPFSLDKYFPSPPKDKAPVPTATPVHYVIPSYIPRFRNESSCSAGSDSQEDSSLLVSESEVTSRETITSVASGTETETEASTVDASETDSIARHISSLRSFTFSEDGESSEEVLREYRSLLKEAQQQVSDTRKKIEDDQQQTPSKLPAGENSVRVKRNDPLVRLSTREALGMPSNSFRGNPPIVPRLTLNPLPQHSSVVSSAAVTTTPAVPASTPAVPVVTTTPVLPRATMDSPRRRAGAFDSPRKEAIPGSPRAYQQTAFTDSPSKKPSGADSRSGSFSKAIGKKFTRSFKGLPTSYIFEDPEDNVITNKSKKRARPASMIIEKPAEKRLRNTPIKKSASEGAEITRTEAPNTLLYYNDYKAHNIKVIKTFLKNKIRPGGLRDDNLEPLSLDEAYALALQYLIIIVANPDNGEVKYEGPPTALSAIKLKRYLADPKTLSLRAPSMFLPDQSILLVGWTKKAWVTYAVLNCEYKPPVEASSSSKK